MRIALFKCTSDIENVCSDKKFDNESLGEEITKHLLVFLKQGNSVFVTFIRGRVLKYLFGTCGQHGICRYPRCRDSLYV